MSTFTARVVWVRDHQPFLDNRYSRAHRWEFDGGLAVPASSSPFSVPVPMSDPSAVDPEEALVAAASSCHMLFFLSLAAQRGFVVERYDDNAAGLMEKNAEGRIAMTRITLAPNITFEGKTPTEQELAELHHAAHDKCYIANSIKAEVVIAA